MHERQCTGQHQSQLHFRIGRHLYVAGMQNWTFCPWNCCGGLRVIGNAKLSCAGYLTTFPAGLERHAISTPLWRWKTVWTQVTSPSDVPFIAKAGRRNPRVKKFQDAHGESSEFSAWHRYNNHGFTWCGSIKQWSSVSKKSTSAHGAVHAAQHAVFGAYGSHALIHPLSRI